MASKPASSLSLEALIKICEVHRIHRLRVENVEIEMHASAFEKPMSEDEIKKAMGVPVNEDLCTCGHSISVMHNESGCLGGCPVAKCAPPEEE